MEAKREDGLPLEGSAVGNGATKSEFTVCLEMCKIFIINYHISCSQLHNKRVPLSFVIQMR